MWLVLGAEGQLGRCLQVALDEYGASHIAATRRDVDITDPSSVHHAFTTWRPSVVVNCAAWTAVDDAEANEGAALAVNCNGARVIAEASAAIGAKLVHVSTDYVFSGRGNSPIAEDASCAPLNAYGRTKWEGEKAVMAAHPDGSIVVRTAWLYSAHGKNFARTMVARALAGSSVRVVDDQHGQPTSADDLAAHIIDLINASVAPGIYHGTNEGNTTWFGFAREIYRLLGLDTELVAPVPSSEYPTPAARPAWSVLGHDRTVQAGVVPMREWQMALESSLPRIVAATQGG